MKKGDVIRQKCVNTTFYLTAILPHKVNNDRYIIACLLENIFISEHSFSVCLLTQCCVVQ